MPRTSLISILTSAGIALSLATTQSHAETLTEVQQRIKTPAIAYIHAKVSYQYSPDPFGPIFLPSSGQIVYSYMDYMLPPADFHALKRGDCEDFANFNTQALRSHGHDAGTYIICGKKNAHAVCIVKERDGTYTYVGNDRYRKGLPTLEAAIEVYDRHWTKYGEMNEDDSEAAGYYTRWIRNR